MQKIYNLTKKYWILLLLLLLTIPSFYRMLRPGVFSMQDFPIFRQFQYNKCLESLEIPCRWAPDSAMGYGEPVFNFYGQLTFFVGSLMHLIGISTVDSVKTVFIISLAGSAVTMFFLAKHLWKNNYSAFVSSIIYLYAPYRSLDVWVRGAYAESFAFIIFPLVILFLDRYFEKHRIYDLLYYSLSLFLLVITHNLSLFMFIPFLGIWIIYRLFESKNFKLSVNIGLASVFGAILSMFYLLPAIFEIKYINIQPIITGYFYFAGHFPTLKEIFISRFWGYGASLWGPVDDLSLSLGQVQWMLPVIVLFVVFVKKQIKNNLKFFVLLAIGFAYVFLMHNKSTFIWTLVPQMAFIQFPWRFLGQAVFAFSLASGAIIGLFNNKFSLSITLFIIIITIVLNIGFFKEDKWNNNSDSAYLSGWEWDLDRSASKEDYWPIFAPIPSNHPEQDETLPLPIISKSNYFKYKINVKDNNDVILPVTYFPGWKARANNIPVGLSYNENGLIKLNLVSGEYDVVLNFTNTVVRNIGNFISLLSFVVLFIMFSKIWKEKI